MLQKGMLDNFRRAQSSKNKLHKTNDIYFQFNFDTLGAYLLVVDKKGIEVEVSYLSYSGAIRQVLRSLERLREKNMFAIDWEKSSDNIYINEYDFILEPLKLCHNIVDTELKPISYSEIPGKFQVVIQDKLPEEGKTTDLISSKIGLLHSGIVQIDFKLLSESYILSGGQIINVPPLGNGFKTLDYFSGEFILQDLSLFLSLLFSNLEHINIHFKDYQFHETKEYIHAKPCLIFEKVDVDDSLYMRVGQSLPELDLQALEQFELYRYAEINEVEKIINIKYIEQEPIQKIVAQIHVLLKKHIPKAGRGKKKEEDIVIDGNLFFIPKTTASNFIYQELPALLTEYQIFGAEKMKSYKISAKSPSLTLSLNHNIDFFEGDVQLDFDGEKINIFDVLNQFNQKNYVKLSDGTHALLNEAYVRRLERLFKKKGKKAQLSFFDLPEIDELIDEKIANDDTFKKPRAFFDDLNNIQSKRTRIPKVNATLRPYQKFGYKWLRYLHEHKLNGCLADDMGLGKTLQAISLMVSLYATEKKPTMVVMPRSLLFNWNNEIQKYAPELTTYTFYGNTRDLKAAKKVNLIFTTYAIMRNEIEQLKEVKFAYIILDESQNIKNINAQTTKAVMLLNSQHRLALSGTPIENNLGELYSLFRFLNPSMFGSLHQFNTDYLAPIQKNNDKTAALHLRKKIYPFVLRRLKKDVLKDLPDKIEQTLFVEMSDAQKKLYEQRRQFYQGAIEQQIATQGMQQSRFFIFQALNELRQIASIPESISNRKVASPKIELLAEQLMDAFANNHKVLIFVNYLMAIELISEELDKMGIDFVSMSGSTRNREQVVERFQNDPNCRAFVMTIKTGGTGLNLTAADTIFIFDPWWNVAAENQAIDRAHRIGQTSKVLAYKLITQGTIEEKILKLQELKKELFDSVITADSGSLKSLTEDDIDFILSSNK